MRRAHVALITGLCLILGAALGLSTTRAADDPRDIRTGRVIPDEGYCDQPYVVVLPGGGWLCVLTTGKGRGKGLGRVLVREAIARTEALYPGRAIRIGAQQRLDRFYRELGFEPSSDPYMEDGIPHIEMVRTVPRNEHA